MKTLVLFDEITEELFFFELEGDYSHLNDVYINGDSEDDLVDQLLEIVYGKDNEGGKIIVNKLIEPTRDWDFFIKCGILP